MGVIGANVVVGGGLVTSGSFLIKEVVCTGTGFVGLASCNGGGLAVFCWF